MRIFNPQPIAALHHFPPIPRIKRVLGGARVQPCMCVPGHVCARCLVWRVRCMPVINLPGHALS